MENITLGQIALAVAFVVGLATGMAYMHKLIKKWLTNALKSEFDGLNKKIDSLSKRIEEVDMEATKNFLVRVLADIEQDSPVDEVERMRFWEAFQHYSKHGGNSYIRDKVEKLQRSGKL